MSCCSLAPLANSVLGFLSLPASSVLMSHRSASGPQLCLLCFFFHPCMLFLGARNFPVSTVAVHMPTTLRSTFLAQICFLSTRHIQRVSKWTTPLRCSIATSYLTHLEMSLSSSSADLLLSLSSLTCCHPQMSQPKTALASSLASPWPATPNGHEVLFMLAPYGSGD